MPISRRRKPKKRTTARRRLAAVLDARLEVDASCCKTVVTFAGWDHGTPHHADDCPGPDDADVARIVGLALADAIGQPVMSMW